MDEKEQSTMSAQIELAVLQVLNDHRGFENRVSRTRLQALVSVVVNQMVRDREMREAIERLRATKPEGAYICSTTSGGYWMATSIQELENYLAQDERRAKRTLMRISRQRMRAGKALTNVPLMTIE